MSTRPGGSSGGGRPPVTLTTLQDKYRKREPITMVTAYDYPTAKLVDEAGVDAILVGDTLAMVVLGHENTLSVTMEEMLHHARAVRRGASGALLVGDMPFLSYQASESEAVRNAGHFLQVGMDSVKLEGGRGFAATVRALVRAGIPVQGHIGLTPQSVNLLGGYKVQGRTADSARALLEDALALEDAGCFSLVLESVPDRVAGAITERLHIPTIGIGAGVATSGQVLVLHDLTGLFDRFTPKFAKRYAELGGALRQAVVEYCEDVRRRAFPGPEHSYSMREEEWQAFCEVVGEKLPDAVDPSGEW
jgi:3-methyl-2-oxobutanoate hydroxymethyltransferase